MIVPCCQWCQYWGGKTYLELILKILRLSPRYVDCNNEEIKHRHTPLADIIHFTAAPCFYIIWSSSGEQYIKFIKSTVYSCIKRY